MFQRNIKHTCLWGLFRAQSAVNKYMCEGQGNGPTELKENAHICKSSGEHEQCPFLAAISNVFCLVTGHLKFEETLPGF